MLTSTGYRRSTYEDILSDLTAKSKELFGEDIDVSDQTVFGKILNLMSYVRAKDHEEAELIYYSRFPNSAQELNLDRLCPFFGLTRNPALSARYEIVVTGEENTTIPFGFLVATDYGVEFYNLMETTIASGETTCTITVECTEAGANGNVAMSDITEIVNPVAGVESIKAVKVARIGENEESDYELRKRIDTVSDGAGSCNVKAIRAALMRVPNVTGAVVLENETDEIDANGLLPHSIACYVSGGEDYEIAETIFETKAAGIKTNGDLSVGVKDDAENVHEIKYSRIKAITIYVKIEIATTVEFSGDSGIEEIKDNIMGYIHSLEAGTDVILSQLYGYIYAVNGVGRVNSLLLSTDGQTYTANDITVSALEYAVCNDVVVNGV